MGQSASQPEGIYVCKQFSSPFTLSQKTFQTFTDSATYNSSSSSKAHSPGSSGSGSSSNLYLLSASSTGIGDLLYGGGVGGNASPRSLRERRASVCAARAVKIEKYSIGHDDFIKSMKLSGYFVMDSANVFVNEKLVVQYCHIYGPISNKSQIVKKHVSSGLEETLNLGNDSKWVEKDFDFIIKHDYKRMVSEEKLTIQEKLIVESTIDN